MGTIFITMQQWIAGSLFISIAGSFIWGILSIVLSPCHLATIPLIIGFISSMEHQTTKKAFVSSLLFAFGMFISIVLIGLITLSLGRIAGDVGGWGDYLIGGLLILFGLNLTGIITLGNWSGASISTNKLKPTPFRIFIFGFLLGVGLGPCTFAFMAPILVVVFEAAQSNLTQALLILLFFTIGHVGVIVLAGTFAGAVQKYLKWSESSKGIKIVKIICGLLVIAAGVHMILK
jgi:cytochrome c-type biogenesis protein